MWIRNVDTVAVSQQPAIFFYPNSATTWGYAQKLLWIIEPSFSEPVTIVAQNIATARPVFMSAGGGVPTATLVLHPNHPGVPGSGDPEASNPQLRYAEFPTEIYVQAAGCIEFTASWAAGRWSGALAAGLGD